MNKDIFFITSNKNKLREFEGIIGFKPKQYLLDLVEIQEIDVKKVIKYKAFEAYKIIKKPVIVEDTGLYFDYFDGFPGALIKWLLISLGNKKICDLLIGKNSKCFAKTCYGFYDGKIYKIFEGKIKGKISKFPKGKTSFGWDPIFIPDGYSKTFAQMTPLEKNSISMRKIALQKLKKYLNKNF